MISHLNAHSVRAFPRQPCLKHWRVMTFWGTENSSVTIAEADRCVLHGQLSIIRGNEWQWQWWSVETIINGNTFWMVDQYSLSQPSFCCHSTYNWLVVYLPLWKMMEFVSWDDNIPNIWTNKNMFQTTNQIVMSLHVTQTVPSFWFATSHPR